MAFDRLVALSRQHGAVALVGRGMLKHADQPCPSVWRLDWKWIAAFVLAEWSCAKAPRHRLLREADRFEAESGLLQPVRRSR